MKQKSLKLVGEKLKRAVKNENFTMHRLSEKTGISVASLYEYINGKRIPKFDCMLVIANALNCTLLEIADLVDIEDTISKDDEIDLSEIGGRIKYKRLELEMNQEALGKLLNVHQGSISAWERNINVPSDGYINKLAIALETTNKYLLYGKEDKINE